MKEKGIMIIDDIPEDINFIKSSLIELEIEITSHTNIKAAFLALENLMPSILIINRRISGFIESGFENEFIKNRKKKGVVFIFINESSSEEEKNKAFINGFDDFISRPFSKIEIFKRIELYLNQRKKKIEILNNKLELKKQKLELDVLRTKLQNTEKMASLGSILTNIAKEIKTPIEELIEEAHKFDISLSELKSFWNDILDQKFENFESLFNKVKKINSSNMERKISHTEELLKNLDTAGRRAASVISGLKSFVKSDKNAITKTDVNKCIESTIDFVKQLQNKNVCIEKNLSEIPQIQLNPSLLNQVLMNLLINAYNAIMDKGEVFNDYILVDTSSEFIINRDYIIIKITDSGIGIKDDIKTKIFDPYFTTRKDKEGMGLGLSVSAGIVEGFGGRLVFDSEFGKGSTFKVLLPVEHHSIAK